MYTVKRKGALMELTATDTVVTQVGESLRMVTEKLEQLEEEKEAIEKFKVMDKRRRAVEFAIVEGDMQEAKQKFEEVERGLNEYEEETIDAKVRFEKENLEAEKDRGQLSKLKRQLKVLVGDMEDKEEEVENLARSKEALELNYNIY